jgi:cytochrome c peroxidase
MRSVSVFLLLPLLILGFAWQQGERIRDPAKEAFQDPANEKLQNPANEALQDPANEALRNPALENLGRFLFFDPRLSGDGSMSCATCHDPAKSYTDGRALSRAYAGSDGFRNTKTILNAMRASTFYWDGRLSGSDPETQVRDAITETHFMNMDGRLMLERLKQIPEYVQMFADVFGEGVEPSFGSTLRAIAAFEKTLVTGPTPYDLEELSESAVRGRELFEGSAGCTTCHSGDDFTDGEAHSVGVPENNSLFDEPLRHLTYRSFIKAMGVPGYMSVRRDVGRFTVTKDAGDIGRFMTPSLRQASRTAPYMHNGVFPTLTEVAKFYSEGAGGTREPLNLSGNEIDDLVAFLESLTGPEPDIEIPTVPRYRTIDDWMEVPN